MNIHDIELPPEFQSGNSIPVERATITRDRMTEILQDAIEADRQSRGEPVEEGWKLIAVNEVWDSLVRALDRAASKGYMPDAMGEEWNAFDWTEAPQPAEPDYKQLFEQMCERCDALDAKLAEYSEREPVAYGIKAVNTGKIAIVLYGSDVDQVGEYRADLVVPLYTTPHQAEPDDPNTSPRSGKGPFESASDLINSINEPVKAPGDGVRCNWCGWRGIEDDLVIEIAADEPEEGPANVCPTCKRIGCLMDLGCDERAAQGLPQYSPLKPTEEEWARLTENGRRAWGKQPAEPTNKHSLSVAEPEKEPPCDT